MMHDNLASRSLWAFATLGLFITLWSCGHRRSEVHARAWDIQRLGPQYYPETHDPEFAYPPLKSRPSFGIAFSGGGNRSATATIGQLRALHALGWLNRAQYVSSVSGASWTVVPYTFLTKSDSDGTFLGPYIPPEELNDEILELAPRRSMVRACANAAIYYRFFSEVLLLSGDETYARTIAEAFLDPFDLGAHDRFFCSHEDAVQRILKLNNDGERERLREEDFYLPKNRRPYMIVGATLLSQKSGNPRHIYPVEITPLYTGIRHPFLTEEPNARRPIGGGYISSFAYDSEAPDRVSESSIQDPLVTLGSERYIFSLGDVIGASSAAPQQILSKLQVAFAGFPEFNHWPVTTGRAVRHFEYAHGDGGHADNLGLLTLLARGVKNILVFINSDVAFRPVGSEEPIVADVMYENIISYFRQTDLRPYNVVFEEGEAGLRDLHDAFASRFDRVERLNPYRYGAQTPLIYMRRYQVGSNSRYGIRPYEVKICWIYLDNTEEFLERLSPRPEEEIVQDLRNSRGEFVRFPHYRTFFEELTAYQAIDLSVPMVNALAHQTAWTVMSRANEIAEFFDIGLMQSRVPLLNE